MSEWRADFELLQAFCRQGDQPAFATLTRRHLDLVYATALRKVTDCGVAEEICQNVFGALARKAWQFAPDDSLPSWLHRTTLLESKAWLRGELRRRRREETAAELGTTMKTSEAEPAFAALVPLLDEALLSLREKDRTALLLRFYESHSLRDVGAAVGVSEDAARMRVQSALEKLAEFFKRRGFKTASVAVATAALEHTATTASAAVADAVLSAALQVAPPTITGLVLLLARLSRWSRGKTAAVGVALVVALLLWLWRDQRRAGQGPKLQSSATQLAAKRNDTFNLLTTNERIMKTATSTQLSLLLLSNAWLVASNALAQSAGQAVVFGHNLYNNYGETNVPAAAQSGVVAIAAGGTRTLALKNDGSVLVWGQPNIHSETNVPAAAQSGVTAIAAGYVCLALKNDGSVISWGGIYPTMTNVPPAAQNGVVAIAAGFSHSLVLKNDGSVVAWGGDSYGQTNVPLAAQSGVVAIAAGAYHTVALKTNGSVLAWGSNIDGESDVPPAAQSGVAAIAAGQYFTAALKQDGSVCVWGGIPEYGLTNVPPAAQSGVIAIAAGTDHILALKQDGSVVAWGRSLEGQTTVPAGLRGVTAISAGVWHSVALVGSGWEMGAPLALRRSNEAVLVSWPTNATGFTLQSTQDLTAPANWLDVTNPPAVTGGQFIVTNFVSATSQFFRLKKP